MKERNQTLRKKTFVRDNYTCRKCKLVDKEAKCLEAHHIIPLYKEGKNELDNMITLCHDCHHFAPETPKEFEEYMQEEMDGTSTTLLKAMKKVREEHPELFRDVDNKKKNSS